jgi:(p)ppGpp synthase/HD superfamily hydrolase
MTFSPLLISVIEQASMWHEGQLRKHPTMRIPYIVHPVTVAFLLQRENYDDEVVCAGLLHDVIEDCDVTKEELAEKTTSRIAELVSWVTELPKTSHTWGERKAAYRERLAQAPIEALAIACADHVANLHSSLEAAKMNANVWKLFHANHDERFQHEKAVLHLIAQRLESPLVADYDRLLQDVVRAHV